MYVCMYSNMADWLEVFFPLCVCLFIFGYTSVVTALDNVVMARNSGGTVSKLRFLTKEALKTGKIRINKCDNKNVNNGGNGDRLLAPEFWDTFLDNTSDWSTFEKHERDFRMGFSTKPIDPAKPFIHPSPEPWLKIITVLSSLFVKDGVFNDLRPDGHEFSIDFLRFIKRILFKFPITVPEELSIGVDGERPYLLQVIKYCIQFVKENIQPCFKTKGNPRNPPNDVTARTVCKDELTHLWMCNQKRAINIVKNSGKENKHTSCNIPVQDVQNHFTERCTRTLVDPVIAPPWADIGLPPPPPWQPQPNPVDEREVKSTIKHLPSNKSPGADGVTYDTLKAKINKLTPALVAIFNVCIAHRRVPSDWKHGVVSLLPKTDTPSMDITEWRPISLLLTSYKVFMSIVQSRAMPWIVSTGRLSPRQKGSLPRNGLQEHVFCLKTAISDFMHSSSQHFVTFIDLKDAFGSIDHGYMITALENAGYPPWIVDITRDIYTGSTFIVKTSSGFTQPINRHRGIVQGCPWSLICFEQGIDPWLRWIDENSTPMRLPAPVQGYVDDVSTSSKDEPHLHEVARKTDTHLPV